MLRSLRWLAILLTSLQLALPPAEAAQQLELELDGLQLPIDLRQLEAWTRDPSRAGGDLGLWLNLLDPADRVSLQRLLRAPLLKERSFALQLLNSWSGQQLLREFGILLTQPNGTTSAALLDASLRKLLSRRGEVSTLDLLHALPVERVVLRFDDLLELAERSRQQLRDQSQAIARLPSLNLPKRESRAPVLPWLDPSTPQRIELTVAHRPTPLPLELWPSRISRSSPWVLLLPGLGGNSRELSWLAQALSAQGWPVLVVEHPGSNGSALQETLLGDAPVPGAESLPDRLSDLQAVLAAQRDGQLPPLGPPPSGQEGVVLVGHSLGGLAALMAAGLVPERGVTQRCRRSSAAQTLANPSRLLQCHLPQVTGAGSGGVALPNDSLLQGSTRLRALVAFNPFGSLLWPSGALGRLDLPVLLVGGSLDLVTPPVQEQLSLFQGASHPRSRLVLVEGGSHFSPVRIPMQGEVLFRLGEELVGVEPRKVQELLLSLTLEFLQSQDYPSLLLPQRRQQNGVSAYVLDERQARRWRGLLRTPPPQPAPLRSEPGGPEAPPPGRPAP